MLRRELWVGTLAITLGACASSKRDRADDPGPGDGFAVGHQALALLPAPPGLCLGSGADKDCADPNGCQEPAEGLPVLAPGMGGSGMGGNASLPGTGAQTSIGGMSSTGGTGTGGVGTGGGSAGASSAGASSAGAAGAAAVPVAAAGAPGLRAQATPATCAGVAQSEPATLYLSADDSNSTASPVIVRRLIRTGQRVPPWLVRAWEFLNYYDSKFAPAESGAVRIMPQLSSCPVDGELSFQVALQAEHRAADDRAPLNLTFVLDTSGSMAGTPLELEQSAVRAIAGQLREGDVVSLVTWNTDRRDVLVGHAITGPNDPALIDAANQLVADGGTDLSGGLRRGYELARQHYAAERINRVIVVSDGVANVGVTDEELIGAAADDEEGEAGIYLAGIGVGDGVNDTLMNVVTDRGRGAYVYLDSPEEADKMLGERFLPVIDLAARSVRLELTLPWYMKVAKFYGEQISLDPTEVRPQHLGPNDAMMFFQILRACDASLLHGDDRMLLRATWEDPFTRRAREAVIDTTLNDLAGDDAELTKAAAVAGYAEALVTSYPLTGAERDAVLAEALTAVTDAAALAADPDLEEIAELLRAYRELG